MNFINLKYYKTSYFPLAKEIYKGICIYVYKYIDKNMKKKRFVTNTLIVFVDSLVSKKIEFS